MRFARQRSSLAALCLVGAALAGSSDAQDGTRIIFASTRDGNSEVYVMDADGSHPENLTNRSAADGGFQAGQTWSPDGSRIAHGYGSGDTRNIHVMDADGSNSADLTNASGWWDTEPAWSPEPE